MRDGDILQGRFRLDRQIGRGGFARVFLATDQTLGRQVAIKLLNPELLARDDEHDFLARFRREARAVATLDHPNILGIHDYGEVEGTIYLVMPYVDGGTVHERLGGGHALDPPIAERFLQQVAAALDYAHRRGIVHRDIKPQNMLLRTEDERLLLADFGIAKVLGDTGAQTRTGAVGTIAYMAPEQFRGQISPALDIYALGCVLFQMLTGRVPFPGSTEQMIFGHLNGSVPSLTELGAAKVPTTVQAVVERALQKDPAARYPTAGALASAFSQALVADELPTRAVPLDTGNVPTVYGQSAERRTTPGATPPDRAQPTRADADGSPSGPTPLPPLPTPQPTPPTGAPTFIPPQGQTTGSGADSSPVAAASVPQIPYPSATPNRARSRLPLVAALGALALIVILLGGLALVRRGVGGTPGATAGSTLVAVAATETTAASTPPTPTISFTPVPSASGAPATATVGVPVVLSPTTPATPAPGPTTPTVASPTRAATAPPPRSPLAGQVAVTFSGHTDHLRGLDWTGDGATLVSGAGDGSVRFWQANGTPLRTFSGRTFAVTSVAISPDGTLLAVGADGPSNQAQIWRADGAQIATLSGHTDNVGMVAWSPDGQILATASSDRTVRLWTAAGQPIRTLSGHGDIVQNIAWSPDGSRLVSASWDRTLRVWNREGALVTSLSGHTRAVFGVAWSPDGATIASGSEDGTIRLWKPDGTAIAILTGHERAVSCVAWSPDGRTLASGSFDNTARLWSADGAALATLRGHAEPITTVAWLPDGRGLATGSWDKTIRLWR